jgi:3-oxoadipate enol-lactonase
VTDLLAHDAVGSGPSVLLLHSGVADRRMWRPQLDGLARRHRVLAPDLPGFGDTPLAPGPNDAPAAIVALLDSKGVRRTAVVGASLGGRVALELADRYPSRVDRLVLLAPALRWFPPSPDAVAFGEAEARLLADGEIAAAIDLNTATWLGPEAEPSAMDLVRTMQRRAFEVRQAAEESGEPPYLVSTEPDLSSIAVPTTVVSGELDLPHFRSIAAHLANSIPGAELIRLPWAAHLPSLERPAEVGDLLLALLG